MMIKDKFKNLLYRLEISPETFASKVGVGKSGVYKILRGETKKITKKLADKIVLAFPNQCSYEEIMKLNEVNDSEIIVKGDSKIEVQKIVDIIIDNIEKFKENKDFNEILELEHLERLNSYSNTLKNKSQ